MNEAVDPKEKINHASLALSGIMSGCFTAWQALYAFFWLFGTWLPIWPVLAVIVAWAGILSWSASVNRKLNKPVIWTTYVFAQTVGLIWFMCWLATYSPLRFPLVH